MTLRFPMSAILLLLAAAMRGYGAQAQPSDARDALKASLLERWEGAQRDDLQTVRFEDLGAGPGKCP